MRRYLFLIMLFCLSHQIFCSAAEEKIDMYEKVKGNLGQSAHDTEFLKTSEAKKFCVRLLTEAKNNPQSRRDIVDYVSTVEKVNKDKHSLYPRRSKNYELMDALMREVEADNNNSASFNYRLHLLYHPSDLKRISERVRTLFHKRQGDDESYLLYSYLPDNDVSKEMKFLDHLVQEQQDYGIYLHALRARFGNEKDEAWILNLVDRFKKDQDRVGYEIFENGIEIARTDKVIRKIADSIQDNGYATYAGEMKIERKKVYSQILERIYFDDPTFPHPDNDGNFDFDKVTAWCAKKFGITYPPKPTPLPQSTAAPIVIEGGPFQ